jgi:hypothetical protein
MPTNKLEVRNGPSKADLLRAVTNPNEHLHVSFDTPVDALEAHLDAIEEIGADGVDFSIRGHVASGNLRGAVFAGSYNCESRTGVVVLKQAE